MTTPLGQEAQVRAGSSERRNAWGPIGARQQASSRDPRADSQPTSATIGAIYGCDINIRSTQPKYSPGSTHVPCSHHQPPPPPPCRVPASWERPLRSLQHTLQPTHSSLTIADQQPPPAGAAQQSPPPPASHSCSSSLAVAAQQSPPSSFAPGRLRLPPTAAAAPHQSTVSRRDS